MTISIDDALGQKAEHRASNAGLSLSGWVTEVIRKELVGQIGGVRPSLLEALGDSRLADYELELPSRKEVNSGDR